MTWTSDASQVAASPDTATAFGVGTRVILQVWNAVVSNLQECLCRLTREKDRKFRRNAMFSFCAQAVMWCRVESFPRLTKTKTQAKTTGMKPVTDDHSNSWGSQQQTPWNDDRCIRHQTVDRNACMRNVQLSSPARSVREEVRAQQLWNTTHCGFWTEIRTTDRGPDSFLSVEQRARSSAFKFQ